MRHLLVAVLVFGMASLAGAQWRCTNPGCAPRRDFETGQPTQVVCAADWVTVPPYNAACESICGSVRRPPENLLLGCAVTCPPFIGCRAENVVDLVTGLQIRCDAVCLFPFP